MKPALHKKGLRQVKLKRHLASLFSLMKPALHKKGLRLLVKIEFIFFLIILDETCPTQKGIATFTSLISCYVLPATRGWNLPYTKRDCDNSFSLNTSNSSMFLMKPALHKKGLRQKISFRENLQVFQLHLDETCPTQKGIATDFRTILYALFLSRWNLPYTKRDCDKNVLGYLQILFLLDETCPTQKGIATNTSLFFIFETQ